jgi:hypothetical protein
LGRRYGGFLDGRGVRAGLTGSSQLGPAADPGILPAMPRRSRRFVMALRASGARFEIATGEMPAASVGTVFDLTLGEG